MNKPAQRDGIGYLEFFVAGLPETKGSWRAIGGGRLKRDNPREKAWSTAVAWTAKIASQQSLRGKASCGPSTHRIRVDIEFFLPASIGKKNKRDIDKLQRSIFDALTGLLYVDDEQIDEVHIWKTVRAHEHGAIVIVSELRGQP